MRTVWDYLQSKRFALVLLIVMVVLITTSALIPQKPTSSSAELTKWQSEQPKLYELVETTELNNLYNSKIFFLTLFLMLINISLCTYYQLIRTAKAYSKWKSQDTEEITERFKEREAILVHQGQIKEMRSLLRKRLYFIRQQEGLVIASKNSWGFWGKIGFHFGLVIIVAGALLARSTRLEGYVKMTEGEVFTEKHTGYQRLFEGPFFGEKHSGFQVRLDRVQIGYWPNGRTRIRQSWISIGEKGRLVRTGITRPNYPAIYKGYTILQGSEVGWSAIFVLTDQQGRENVGSVPIATAKFSRDRSSADFLIPGTDFSARAELRKALGADQNIKFWLKYPPDELALKIKVMKKKSRTIIYNGKLRLNQELKLEGNSLTLRKFAPWTSLLVTRDIGTLVIYFGFAMSILGLASIFLVVPKKIFILVTKSDNALNVKLAGKSLKYSSSFEEEISNIRSLIQKKR